MGAVRSIILSNMISSVTSSYKQALQFWRYFVATKFDPKTTPKAYHKVQKQHPFYIIPPSTTIFKHFENTCHFGRANRRKFNQILQLNFNDFPCSAANRVAATVHTASGFSLMRIYLYNLFHQYCVKIDSIYFES